MLNKNLSILCFIAFTLACCLVEARTVSPIVKSFGDISDNIHYDYSNSKSRLDSLKASLSKKDKTECSAYLTYFDAIEAYKTSKYTEALVLADSALEAFLWNRNYDWEARCLLSLAFTAEALMLDDDALDYYSTIISLTNNNLISFLALMGKARSQKRLNTDYTTSLRNAFEKKERINQQEIELLYKRDYYGMLSNSPKAYLELESVANEYLDLRLWTKAATTYKIIAQHYLNDNNYVLAKETIEKALDIIKLDNNSQSIYLASIKITYTSALFFLHQYDEAKTQLDESIQIYERLGQSQSNYYAYLWHSDIAREQSNYQDADEYGQKALFSKNKITQIKKSSSALLLEILINRNHIELQLKTQRKRQITHLSLLAFVSTIITLYLIAIFKKKETKIERIMVSLNWKQNILISKQDELLNIIKKVEKESAIIEDFRNFERIIKQDDVLNKNLDPNFCHVYKHTVSSFAHKHTTLTPAEMRSAVMIAMGIPPKLIVKLMCIEPSSLKTYRKRIRKKLKLNSDTNLNEYLKSYLHELNN